MKLSTLPLQNYQHGRQDRAQLIMEAEPKLKLIHPYQQQISINQDKRYTNRIVKASLFQCYFVLFKIMLIKNIPSCHIESVHLVISRASKKNTQRKMVSVRMNVTCFKPVLV